MSKDELAQEGIIAIEYRATSVMGQKAANEVGPVLVDIAKENGTITANLVIEAARDKKSVLHRHFEWDDTKAAGHYRSHQARILLSSIEVKVTVAGEATPQWVRYFHSVKIPVVTAATPEQPEAISTDVRRYVGLETLRGNKDFLQQVIRDAYQQLEHWQSRYKAYRAMQGFHEFEPIMAQIDALKEQRAAPPVPTRQRIELK